MLDDETTTPEPRTCAGPSCSRPVRSFDLCDSHGAQRRSGRQLTPIRLKLRHGATAEEKLAARTKREGECLIWTGSRNDWGYGTLWVDGKSKRAHVVAWELVNGPVPPGLCVCHNCPTGDNPACVRVEHLWLGTNAENVADRDAKGRGASGATHWSSYSRGGHNPRSRLTAADVLTIRVRLAAGESQGRIATDFGVSQATIWRIRSGACWSHLRSPEATTR